MKRVPYFVPGAVIAASVVTVLLLPHGDFIQTLASVPIFASLAAIVVEVLREQARGQRGAMLARDGRRFSLASSSHMASTAFDRHVAFSEAYLSEVSAALRTLVREGPNHEALKHSDRLYEIKRQYVLWLTPDLEKRLEPFERALRKIGAAGTVSRKFPNSENSQKWHAEMFQSFAEVLGTEHMGKEWDGKAISDEAAIRMVVSHLRSILVIEELTALRIQMVKNALKGSADDA